MKKILLSISLAVAGLTSSAQIADGSTAPAIHAFDVYGEIQQLYPHLDSGKTVVLDFFATWCGPCWNYHNDHVLEDLFKEKGPEGDNSFFVMMIESSGSTSADDVFGPSSNSYGDWTAGTSFPILNNNKAPQDYEVSGYPTIMMVCPDKETYFMEDVYYGGLTSAQDYIDFRDANCKTLSAGSKQESTFNLFPNPTNGIINFTANYNEPVTVEVYNMLGELVYSQANLYLQGTSIDLSDLTAGNYVVSVKGVSIMENQKITIK